MATGKPRPWIPWAGILLLAVACSCAKAVKPPVLAAEAADEAAAAEAEPVTPAEPVSSDEDSAPSKPAPEAEPEATKPDPTTVYIDSGADAQPRTRSLVEASRAEKERRSKASSPVAVITNKNLSQFNKGKVTVADPKAGTADAGAPELNQDEAKWRSRGRDIRIRWRDATERVKQLELDTAGWRRRFYAENDAALRDRQIKPEWDRTLDELRQARIAVETAQKDLVTFLDEGRAAGALPGWLREGAELEPDLPPDTPSPTEAIEPPIARIDGRP